MHYWFLGYAFRLFNGDMICVRVLQALVSCAGLLLVYPVCRNLVGRPASLAATAIVAFSPEFWMYACVLMTEPLTTVFVLSALWLSFISLNELHGLKRFAPFLAGVCWGLAALTRDEYLYIGVAVGVVLWWVSGRSKRSALRTAGLVLGMVLCIAPYTARNAKEFKGFIPIADNGSYALWEHWNSTVPQNQIGALFFSWPVDERNGLAMHKAVQNLAANPVFVAKRCVRSFCRMWTPDDMLITAFYSGCFGSRFDSLIVPQYAATALLIALMAVFYTVYSVVNFRQKQLLVLQAVVVTSLLLHAIAFGQGRHREPYMPLMLAAAVQALLCAPELLRRQKQLFLTSLAAGVILVAISWLAVGSGVAQAFDTARAASATNRSENRMYKLLIENYRNSSYIAQLWQQHYTAKAAGKPAPPVRP